MSQKKMKLKRVWQPIDKWEEIEANMWGDVEDKKAMLEKAIKFTGNHKMYGLYMMKVVMLWRHSCENAFTDSTLNHRAWVGHAACAMALGCPEDITRKAWGHLTDEQQLLANQEAERAISVWRYAYLQNQQVCDDLGG